MIVKVQVVNGNNDVLIHNEKKTIERVMQFTPDMEKKMGGNKMMFFDATLKKGNITLNRPVKNQSW